MVRAFSEGEPKTVAELVSKYGGTLSVSREPNSPLKSIDINLHIAQGLPETLPCPGVAELYLGLKLPADFEECKGSMRLELQTSVYPFERSGVVARFHNVQTYICGECGTDSSTEDRTQDMIIGRSLHMMSEQFVLRNIIARPPSINRVRSALQI